MRIRGFCAAFLLTIFFGISPAAPAQTKKPDESASAKAPYDPHDLSGVWFDDHIRPMTVMERYWAYKFTADEPPMTLWGETEFKKAKASFGPTAVPLEQTNDPVYHTCDPLGFPRIFLYPLPLQILQTPGEVIFLFEYDSLRHQIFMDGRGHDASLGPLWMGDSIGHWEGDTLVADTVNFNDKTWLDRMGHPHSEQLHIIEHIRRIDHDHMVDEITVEDPKAYSKTWTASLPYVLKPKWTIAEAFCEDEHSFEGIENDETKPSK